MSSTPETWRDLVAVFAGARRYRRDGHVAPHKALAFGWAVGEILTTGTNAWPIRDVIQRVEGLLDQANEPTHSASDPVWRLQADGLCQIVGFGHMHSPSGALRRTPPKGELVASGAEWRIDRQVVGIITSNRDRVSELAEVLASELSVHHQALVRSLVRVGSDDPITSERKRREHLWDEVLTAGGPYALSPSTVRAIGLISGAAGITRDLTQTGHLAQDGVTVGLLLTGTKYADDLDDDALLYHYPRTDRKGKTDAAEIEGTKNALRLELPIFTVIATGDTREVRLGVVSEWDDAQEVFLIEFLSAWNADRANTQDETDAEPAVRVPRKQRATWTAARDSRFGFHVKNRYGTQCAVCDQDIPELIQGAHLIPHSDGGKDTALNGLPLCANHHIGLDRQLWAIDPETLKVFSRLAPDRLALTRVSIEHLVNLPDRSCLSDVWNRYQAEIRKA